MSKRQQHIQHGYSVRELVQAMNVLINLTKQLAHYPENTCWTRYEDTGFNLVRRTLFTDELNTTQKSIAWLARFR